MNPSTVGSYQTFPARRRLSYLGLPGVVLAGGGAALMIMSMPFHHIEHQWPNMAKLALIFLMILILAFWAIFLSGLPRKRTAFCLAGLGATGALFFTIDFDGNLEPSIRLRGWLARTIGISRDDDLNRQRQWQKDNLPSVEVDLTPLPSDSPGYRGADRTGVVSVGKLARDWNAHPPRELWRQPVGEGYGSFAVVNDFLFSIEQRRSLEASRDEEAVVCYHAKTGRELWVRSWPGRFSETMGGAGPRTTPTVANGEVYALGAKGHLVCLDGKTGDVKWAVETLDGRKNLQWGMSGSPLVIDKIVVANPGPPGALTAYDRQTGAVVWAEGKQQAGYSSPMLVALADVPQILLFDGRGLAGCDPRTGKELWRYGWKTQGDEGINVAQPIVVGKDRVFIASAYGRGGAMLRIEKGEDQTWSAESVWDTGRTAMRCKLSSPVAHGGFIYGLDDGHLQCLDLETGKVKWTDDRTPGERNGAYGHGQILLCDDLLVILTEYGEVMLVEPNSERLHELGRKKFLKGNKTWNNPALSAGKLYIRNHVEMAAIDLGVE